MSRPDPQKEMLRRAHPPLRLSPLDWNLSGAGPQGRTPPQSSWCWHPRPETSAPPGDPASEVRRFAYEPTCTRKGEAAMRIETTALTISWIPSEAVTGMNKPLFESGVAHYDDPPPDVIDDLDALQATTTGSASRIGSTRGSTSKTAASSARATTTTAAGSWEPPRFASRRRKRRSPHRRLPRNCSATRKSKRPSVRFVQTVGGRTALPAPRRVNHPPFVQWKAPLVWTTLEVILHADGRHEARAQSARARSPGTGCTTTTASSPPRPASPTSRSGTATRSASTRPGATRTRPRS